MAPESSRTDIFAISALALVIAVIAILSEIRSSRRDALWKIVHAKCVPDQQANRKPAPCVLVDISHGIDDGYAILKDRVGKTQFLLIATRRISGIESPDLLMPDAPNYWADAWKARSFVIAAAHRDLDWNMLGLAINSAHARSQDQLHIHIDCLQPGVRALLAQHLDAIGSSWKRLSFPLDSERYIARRLDAAALVTNNPFNLLAGEVGGAGQKMGEETLVVAGATFAPGQNGFILLAAGADPSTGDRAHGEDLLDHACALANDNEAESAAP